MTIEATLKLPQSASAKLGWSGCVGHGDGTLEYLLPAKVTFRVSRDEAKTLAVRLREMADELESA